MRLVKYCIRLIGVLFSPPLSRPCSSHEVFTRHLRMTGPVFDEGSTGFGELMDAQVSVRVAVSKT